MGKNLYFCFTKSSSGENLESYVLDNIIIKNCSLPYLFQYLWNCKEQDLPNPLLLLRTHLEQDLSSGLKRLAAFKEYIYFSDAHNTELRDCSPTKAYERMQKMITKYEQQSTYLQEARKQRLNSSYQESPHFFQFSMHTEDWQYGDKKYALYDHWICFDDYWASKHSNLAESILQYSRDWQLFYLF
jgi:hypothetical protein